MTEALARGSFYDLYAKKIPIGTRWEFYFTHQYILIYKVLLLRTLWCFGHSLYQINQFSHVS